MEADKTAAVRGDPSTNVPDKTDEVVQFFATNPDLFNLMKSLTLEVSLNASSSQDAQVPIHKQHAHDCHLRLLKLIAESKLSLADSSDINPSTVANTQRIISTEADENFSSSDSINDDRWLMDEFVHHLAVSTDPSFTYPPEFFPTRPDDSKASTDAGPTPASGLPGLQSWSYGFLYTMEYPEDTTTDQACKKLKKMGLDLPRTVLDLGRLVTTSDHEDRPDGSSWTPSDFTVMVDMQAEGRPVWLVCDRHILSDLRLFNATDGMGDDFNMVQRLFKLDAMDLVLLFRNVGDWTTRHDTWDTLHDHISEMAMNLGLHL